MDITFPGDISLVETLEVESISDHAVLILNSSIFGDVFYGDVVEIRRDEKGENRFSKVIARSGMAVKVYVLAETAFESEKLQGSLNRLVDAGGVWERVYGGVLLVHIPRDANIDLQCEFGGPEELSSSSSDHSSLENGSAMRPQESTPAGVVEPAASSSQGTVPAPPVENPVWSGWDVTLIAALTFLIVMVLQFGLAKAAQVLWYPHDSFIEAAQKVGERPILLIVSQVLIYIPIALLMIMLIEGKYHVPFWRSVGWNWPRSLWKFLGIGGALLIVLSTLESLLPMPKDTPFEHLFDRPLDAYLLAIIAVTFAPLLEELFFRGLMYPVLARRLGVGWGVLLSSLPFALLHLPQYAYAWSAGFVILVVGVACGLVRATTKSVGASFLVHVGYNGTQMLIAVVLTRGFTHMPKGLLHIGLR